jgi:hypothetical protein
MGHVLTQVHDTDLSGARSIQPPHTSWLCSFILRIGLIDYLFTVLRPAQEYFTYMETSPLPVKGCKIRPLLGAQGLWAGRDWLIIYRFTSRSRIFHLCGDITIAGEWLQNLGLCSALKAFQQGGIFIVPHLLWHGTLVFPVSSEGPPQDLYRATPAVTRDLGFPVSSEGPPHLVAFYDTRGDVEDLF